MSAREDLNPRPTGPKPAALPNCATRRIVLCFIYYTFFYVTIYIVHCNL